jgi:hypothetical protein
LAENQHKGFGNSVNTVERVGPDRRGGNDVDDGAAASHDGNGVTCAGMGSGNFLPADARLNAAMSILSPEAALQVHQRFLLSQSICPARAAPTGTRPSTTDCVTKSTLRQ